MDTFGGADHMRKVIVSLQAEVRRVETLFLCSLALNVFLTALFFRGLQ